MLKQQNAKLVEALEKIAPWDRVPRVGDSNRFKAIAAAALKEVQGA